MLVVSGVRNTQSELFTLVKSDFTGTSGFSGSFVPWVLAIMAIGAMGYVKPVKPISDAFLVLIVIVLFLSNKGVFAKFSSAIGTSP